MIDEAIENIREIKKLDCHIKYPEWQLALTLGIEALERHRALGELDSELTKEAIIEAMCKPLPSEGEK